MEINPVILQELLDKDLEVPTKSILQQFRREVLRQTLLKKYVPPSTAPLLHKEAIDKFIDLNNEVAKFRLSEQFKGSQLVNQWKAVIYDAVMTDDYQTCAITLERAINSGYTGPGSSRKSKDTSFFTKMFDSELSSTSSFLRNTYLRVITGKWLEAEETRHENLGTVIVSGSTLTTVPKDSKNNRTTCTEPTLNMFFQLGVKEQLVKVLERSFLWDAKHQPEINKVLARAGSIDGSLATIDLKSASDSISVELCEFLLPEQLFKTLMQIRSPTTEVNGDIHSLSMIGTMGNGFTFHLMTLMFSALVKAIYITNNVPFLPAKNAAVFGDDIIILTEHVKCLVDTLSDSGLIVNQDKSFIVGPFRESCGGDYYHGHSVRGIYIKEINNESDVYTVFNRLHFWSIRNDIPLYRTLLYIKGLAQFRPIPRHEAYGGGYIVTTRELTAPKRDANGALKYRALIAKPLRQVVEYRLSNAPFKSSVAELKRYLSKDRKILGRGEFGKSNPVGAEIAFIGGFITDNTVTLRSMEPTYVEKVKHTPNWDNAQTYEISSFAGLDRVVSKIPRYFVDPELTTQELSRSWSILLSID